MAGVVLATLADRLAQRRASSSYFEGNTGTQFQLLALGVVLILSALLNGFTTRRFRGGDSALDEVETPMTVLEAFALTGKRALVTGGNRGLGFAFVRGLAEAGADVVFVSRDAERNAAAVAALAQEGLTTSAFEVDVTAPDGPDAAIDGAVERLGGLDLLLNNAGTRAAQAGIGDHRRRVGPRLRRQHPLAVAAQPSAAGAT